jgi:cellulose synthase/poly-beta-1,6-N-acetylglucosamine synthase-like glycosyltransferase
MNFWFILYIIDFLLFVVAAFTTFYLLFFSFTSLINKRTNVPKARHQNRFLVLIPAYQQDEVILHTVDAILGQTYPQRMFDVIVISDHQSEMTNMQLAQSAITLLTPNFEKSTKAKSLQFAMLKLLEFKIYDVVVILDADNIVEPEFLEQMNDAYEMAGTKAVLAHRIPRNRDTPSARVSAVLDEINNSIFRKGHINVGLSAALSGSGVAYDFNWFKANIMKVRSSDEDKELEAQLAHQSIFVDYFDHIFVYDEKVRKTSEFNRQRGRWLVAQLRTLIKNIRFLPIALFNRQYDWVDKIIQWMLLPRTILLSICILMSIILPFIYFTLAIKWWFIVVVFGFAMAFATPDNQVDDHWDKDFITLPISTARGILWRIYKRFKK